jgi:hypothetical protein
MLRYKCFSRRSFTTSLLILLPFALVGCGGKGNVSGTVTLDGKPLPAGKISFLPNKGPAVTAEIKDGKYSAKGVPAGNAKVTVATKYLADEGKALSNPKHNMTEMPEAADAEMKERLAKMKKEAEDQVKKGQALLDSYRKIPDKYTKSSSSGLSVDVKKGDTSFDVPLKSEKSE